MRTALLNCALLALLLTACGTLDPSGPYQGDKTRYSADLAITTAYDVMHTFVDWEKNNRPALATTPPVRQYADYVRANAEQWISTALAIRDAYAANPGPDQADALQKTLAVLHQVVVQATQYLVTSTNQPQPAQ